MSARIAAFRVLCADAAAMRDFYRRAFDARDTPDGVLVGAEAIETVEGARTRDAFLANETGFQHFAVVVADMASAYAKLQAVSRWTPISLNGPERLPAASGGATAFKFRDPEGRPLELLQFADAPPRWAEKFAAKPEALFYGFDHSAITVSDAQASLAFWTGIGFTLAHRGMNRGPEQARLDGLAEADTEVEILSLDGGDGGPGVELLAYRAPAPAARASPNGSTAATAIRMERAEAGATTDPDGHRLAFGRGF